MEGLKAISGGSTRWRIPGIGLGVFKHAGWELRRYIGAFHRAFGAWGWICLSLCLGAFLAWGASQALRVTTQTYEKRFAERQLAARSVPVTGDIPAEQGGAQIQRARLRVFERVLVAHTGIPSAVDEVIRAAREEGLNLSRGEYRAEIDPHGNFMRYRMVLPVKGRAVSVDRFIRRALSAQRALTVESVQFKRERIEDAEVEARIKWVLFAGLPLQNPVGATENLPTSGARGVSR